MPGAESKRENWDPLQKVETILVVIGNLEEGTTLSFHL